MSQDLRAGWSASNSAGIAIGFEHAFAWRSSERALTEPMIATDTHLVTMSAMLAEDPAAVRARAKVRLTVLRTRAARRMEEYPGSPDPAIDAGLSAELDAFRDAQSEATAWASSD